MFLGIVIVSAIVLRRRLRSQSNTDRIVPYPSLGVSVSEKPERWEKGFGRLLTGRETATFNQDAQGERTVIRHQDSGRANTINGSRSVIHVPPTYSEANRRF